MSNWCNVKVSFVCAAICSLASAGIVVAAGADQERSPAAERRGRAQQQRMQREQLDPVRRLLLSEDVEISVTETPGGAILVMASDKEEVAGRIKNIFKTAVQRREQVLARREAVSERLRERRQQLREEEVPHRFPHLQRRGMDPEVLQQQLLQRKEAIEKRFREADAERRKRIMERLERLLDQMEAEDK